MTVIISTHESSHPGRGQRDPHERTHERFAQAHAQGVGQADLGAYYHGPDLGGDPGFFIVTGYRAEVVEDYFGDGARWGVNIRYGRQEVQDGTGKAPEVPRASLARTISC